VFDLADLQAAARGRRAEQAAAESRAFLVGPVDHLDRDRRPSILEHPQRLEAGHHAERAVEPSAVRH
jgi:hypothetical protein